ncbi:vanadium-dependent haloperoxidase [Actibacterium ureilyticum]|uniref:vanadium-dependent haloperoxidase n=1 Tax=Actibacterium ureilyticum TaxID=1590614 RepID=UPI000BAA9ACB|nr:vanadium-dependent haloperoxidase [Actibacterium ureilyticum]
MTTDRRLTARRVREDAAAAAFNRTHPTHKANGDEQKYAAANYAMTFTKGLDHNYDTGLIRSREHLVAFRNCINNGFIEPFTTRVPVPRDGCKPRRQWEAPTAGTAFDLQGPDAQAVTMPPAPELCSDELAFEMAEVYELALLRDKPFYVFDQNGGPGSGALNDTLGRLNALPFAQAGFPGRPRKTEGGVLTRQTAFRGSAPGVEAGPYISQFLLIGNSDQTGASDPTDGRITYGAQQIDQRVAEAAEGDDFMMLWDDWYEVQQGFKPAGPAQNFTGSRRWIFTPRDLATYVHFDALYQAYLNAALILWSNGTPLDPNFDHLSGSAMHKFLVNASTYEEIDANAGGFALYGGPHILTLVTEVATRALKAVRYQKFNNHLRPRPEVLGARLEKADWIDQEYPATCGCFTAMRDQLADTIAEIRDHNQNAANGGNPTALLPMAFAEGSPMHPSYGAGHATVAGACVTILKAFFDTSALFGLRDGQAGFHAAKDISEPIQYWAVANGNELSHSTPDCPLTLEGELNKLAANISIGRNMAGVHYFSDYYDSLRMGEQIAIGMLQEQALCYPTDPFVMTVPTFDGDAVRIGAL